MYLTEIKLRGSLFLGQMPSKGVPLKASLDSLSKEILDGVVVLLSQQELREDFPELLPEYRRRGYRVLLYPIPDFGIPHSMGSFAHAIDVVAKALSQNKNILVHCRGGIGRTGLFATAVLIKMTKYSATAALQYLRSRLPGAVETKQQLHFLRQYEEYNAKKI